MSEAGATRAGTATVLFTDLVASTQVRQALGDERADDLRRAHDRILRMARTIVDLEDADQIRPGHISEAIGYRTLDRKLWG